MTKKQEIQIFENKKERTAWDSETEQWYFSIVYSRYCGYFDRKC